MSKIEQREADLQGTEAAAAMRLIEWFDLLEKLRHAASAGVEPQAIVEQLKRIDPDMLFQSHAWLMTYLYDRFEGEFGKVNTAKALVPLRAKARKAIKRKGDVTRDRVKGRFLIYRDTYRTPADEIPAKIAGDLGLALGTVQNILRELRRAARI